MSLGTVGWGSFPLTKRVLDVITVTDLQPAFRIAASVLLLLERLSDNNRSLPLLIVTS